MPLTKEFNEYKYNVLTRILGVIIVGTTSLVIYRIFRAEYNEAILGAVAMIIFLAQFIYTFKTKNVDGGVKYFTITLTALLIVDGITFGFTIENKMIHLVNFIVVYYLAGFKVFRALIAGVIGLFFLFLLNDHLQVIHYTPLEYHSEPNSVLLIFALLGIVVYGIMDALRLESAFSMRAIEDKNTELYITVTELEASLQEKSDIFTQQYALRKLDSNKSQMLKSIIAGKSLKMILEELVILTESQTESIASIILLEEDGETMKHAASVQLPDFYIDAISTQKIGPDVGSCGAAMFKNEIVIASDLNTHPNWTAFKELISKTSLKSCWSMPITSTDGHVLGSFCLFRKEVHTPKIQEKRLIEGMASIAALAIEVSRIQKMTQAQEKLKSEKMQAQRSLEFKTDFLAQMSHEIRTPLNGVIGMADILAKNTDMTPDQRDYLSTMQEAGYDLMQIINDILDMSKIEAGKMQLKPVPYSLEKIINKCKDLYVGKAEEKGLDLNVELSDEFPEAVEVDAIRLAQVLNNLISNAIKFTERGGVTIRGEFVGKVDDRLEIKFSIKDTGPGISEGDQKLLFSKYDQVGSSVVRSFDGKNSGTGLGLYICTNLIKLMGGNLDVDSKLRHGSTFYFNAKFFPAELKEKVEETKEKATGFNKTILLVEDKLVNQKVATLMLQSLGCEVVVVENGEEALFNYKDNQGKYDLILMDIQMPIMDGVTATAELKANFPGVPPIIALSANNMEGDAEKYMAKGLDDYMAKPIVIDALRDKLNQYFT